MNFALPGKNPQAFKKSEGLIKIIDPECREDVTDKKNTNGRFYFLLQSG